MSSSQRIRTLNKELFRKEYTAEFVDRWDELINWRGRWESEQGFFQHVLQQHNAKRVLDIACGTGFHTIMLSREGLDVTGADGSATMVAKARENAARFNLPNIPVVEAEWTSLTETFKGETFDAILCLGNAFTHLFEEKDRVKALGEIYQLLRDGGVAIIDQRNYDKILDKKYDSKHQYYYLGQSVDVYPEEVTDRFVKLRYKYNDGSAFHLTLAPIRQDYVTDLLKKTGFRNVERYGDFASDYDHYDPDFIIQIATK